MAEVIEHPGKRGGLIASTLLKPTHDFSRFHSGNEALDDWLKNRALDSEGKTARTYVMCEDNVVIGYYCIASGSVERAAIPKPIKRHGLPNQVPVAIIGRLARDLPYKGKGIGLDLLQHALHQIVHASETIGIRAILVHAIDDKAAAFWKGAEFIESPIGSRTFYLPIETIIDALP
ncbi:GNAT family N-acetyltransferase [Bradyrhizobium sp. RDI18]|uniref:GNAT family N-acetyltransferase n=1 Tax=Bradyrhizobium sp. RDI18 TaxID=3367400 RepID=UPI00371C872F